MSSLIVKNGLGVNLRVTIDAPGYLLEIVHGSHMQTNNRSWWLMARKKSEDRRPRRHPVLAKCPTMTEIETRMRGLVKNPAELDEVYAIAHARALGEDRRQDVVAWAQRTARDSPQALLDAVRAAIALDPSLAAGLHELPPEETP